MAGGGGGLLLMRCCQPLTGVGCLLSCGPSGVLPAKRSESLDLLLRPVVH